MISRKKRVVLEVNGRNVLKEEKKYTFSEVNVSEVDHRYCYKKEQRFT